MVWRSKKTVGKQENRVESLNLSPDTRNTQVKTRQTSRVLWARVQGKKSPPKREKTQIVVLRVFFLFWKEKKNLRDQLSVTFFWLWFSGSWLGAGAAGGAGWCCCWCRQKAASERKFFFKVKLCSHSRSTPSQPHTAKRKKTWLVDVFACSRFSGRQRWSADQPEWKVLWLKIEELQSFPLPPSLSFSSLHTARQCVHEIFSKFLLSLSGISFHSNRTNSWKPTKFKIYKLKHYFNSKFN